MKDYNHAEIEAKCQKLWEKHKVFEPDLKRAKKPYYNLMMFPYPSAEGLHVGSMFAFTGSDIFGRKKRMQGFEVFEPIGLDGFGINSENYAMKINEHPSVVAKRTQENFYRQLHSFGNSFDWSAALTTYDPNYYKWTQWIFVQLFKAGLAYRGESEVNWCPSCLTVLADEQVISKQLMANGQQLTVATCERCGSEVKRRRLTQWFFRITKYSQRLLDGLSKIDWSEKVKIAQRNWLGKSKGAMVLFSFDTESDYSVDVFTTRPDTLYGVTYLALAPAHPLVTRILNDVKGSLQKEIREFLDYSSKRQTSRDKRQTQIEKSGVFTGLNAINPLSGKKVPVYIADYVLVEYGSGAVMGVPAHDERDWEFAKKYGIEIAPVIAPPGPVTQTESDISRKAFTDYGVLVNSGKYSDLTSQEAVSKITADLEEKKLGSEAVTWHLRDWIISRQRYWGPPIPMIFCEKCAKKGKSWFTENLGPVAGSSYSMSSAGKSSRQNTDSTHDISNFKFKIKNSSHEMRGWYPVPEEELPVELPYIENFKPTGSGVSPLSQDQKFVNVKCPGCGKDAKRETDVSDTFLDSAWYYLRYPSVNKSENSEKSEDRKTRRNQKVRGSDGSENLNIRHSEYSELSEKLPWDPEITRKWLPVDMYIGGAEHAVLHLLYSRFITMVFKDLGYLDFEEPFTTFRVHGLLIKDGAKMSKSKGNIVTPDDYIAKFGADTFRCYLMFCGRYSAGGDFRDSGIEGMQRFLKRVWKIATSKKRLSSVTCAVAINGPKDVSIDGEGDKTRRSLPCKQPRRAFSNQDRDALYMMHKTIKKVSEDIDSLDYNTAISALMEWVNFLEQKVNLKEEKKTINHEPLTINELKTLLLLLAPFAPHMTEELFQRFPGNYKHETLNSKQIQNSKFKSIHLEKWPEFDEKLATAEKVTLVVQVNGKLRDRIEVKRGLSKDLAIGKAKKLGNVGKYLSTGKLVNLIFVPDKLVNFVVQAD